ncbi:MAG TPA: hypothetical protein VIO64_10730 [Pseudobacteroides sp.]|uniref:hypothetical protein n=1 Tax=Pseudobacteroides sp. TaxID=1968840 RepID=UPI002F953FC9
MIESLVKNCSFEAAMNNTAAGTGDTLNGDIIDLGTGGNFDSVLFVAKLGDCADTAVGTLKAYCGDASDVADGAYKAVTAAFTATATNSDNKLVILDVVKPGKRYVRPDFVRATANIAVESIIAIKYNSKSYPVTQGTDVRITGISVN